MKLVDIKGIGPNLATKLNQLGIYSPLDIVNFLPSQYINLKEPTAVDKLENTSFALIQAKILKITPSTNPRKQFFKLEVQDSNSFWNKKIYISYFNQNYYLNKFLVGNEYRFLGKVTKTNFGYEMINPLVEEEDKVKNLHDGIYTIYPLKGIVGQNVFKNLVKSTTAHFEEKGEDYYTAFGKSISESINQPSLLEAINGIHFPNNEEEIKKGMQRLAIEDTANSIGIYRLINYKFAEKDRKVFYKIANSIIVDYKNALSVVPTPSQENAFYDIVKDLGSSKAMRRIINGDVGSGKTYVAFFALYCAVCSGHQAAMMAPTELLANQHANSFKEIAMILNIKYDVLTSSTTAKHRKEILSKVYNKELDVLFGTQSLLNEDIIFDDLSLIVIDEQHKFGVSERKALEDKCRDADVISMSATPIPRTMFLTMYKGIAISHIERRSQNDNIKTHIVPDEKLGDMLTYIAKQCASGLQAFIVCPSIEDSEGFETYSAKTLYEATVNSVFNGLRVGLLYGPMKSEEKNKIMNDYSSGTLDILISTTVIEVGIDTNASILTIMNSERFGLAQLHQLRGRIGRRGQNSFCFLHTTKPENERLRAMVATSDGLTLAEKDFEMRGAGDFIGLSQSGHRQTGKYSYPITISVIKNASSMVDLAIAKDRAKTLDILKTKKEEYKDYMDIMFNTTLSS